MADRPRDLRFGGWIAGLGTTSGWRVVVGCWPVSPYGPVADVMVESTDGHRLLLAPTSELAELVAATYVFDEVQVLPVALTARGRVVRVQAGPLDLTLEVGGRTALGRLIALVPDALGQRLWWVALCDRVARLVLTGVRTAGSAGGGHREWYAASDNRRLALRSATWDGRDLGRLADVEPPVRFGFGSTPREPSWTKVTTTVRLPPAGAGGSGRR